MVAIAITLLVLKSRCHLWSMFSRNRLLDKQANPAAVRAITRCYRVGPVVYLVAFLLAFVSATASLTMTILLAVFFALPGPNDHWLPGTQSKDRRQVTR